tara:strand:- start:2 stop:166 length:165 start_codon:yes stop_codon:yes gene_type:complete
LEALPPVLLSVLERRVLLKENRILKRLEMNVGNKIETKEFLMTLRDAPTKLLEV